MMSCKWVPQLEPRVICFIVSDARVPNPPARQRSRWMGTSRWPGVVAAVREVRPVLLPPGLIGHHWCSNKSLGTTRSPALAEDDSQHWFSSVFIACIRFSGSAPLPSSHCLIPAVNESTKAIPQLHQEVQTAASNPLLSFRGCCSHLFNTK